MDEKRKEDAVADTIVVHDVRRRGFVNVTTHNGQLITKYQIDEEDDLSALRAQKAIYDIIHDEYKGQCYVFMHWVNTVICRDRLN